jgi:hypothetical protein
MTMTQLQQLPLLRLRLPLLLPHSTHETVKVALGPRLKPRNSLLCSNKRNSKRNSNNREGQMVVYLDVILTQSSS